MSILTMIPIKPNNHPDLTKTIVQIGDELVKNNKDLELNFYMNDEPSLPTDSRPWSKVARIRNKMLDSCNWKNYDWLFWVDADIVELPSCAPSQLIEVAKNGIAAPMILAGKTNTFYDWAAFIQAGTSHIEPTNRWRVPRRNIDPLPPYFNEELVHPAVVSMDCVGCCYIAHTDIFKTGVRFEDHPAFTDHFPICQRAREMGRPVVVDESIIARHAWLPYYGEKWH